MILNFIVYMQKRDKSGKMWFLYKNSIQLAFYHRKVFPRPDTYFLRGFHSISRKLRNFQLFLDACHSLHIKINPRHLIKLYEFIFDFFFFFICEGKTFISRAGWFWKENNCIRKEILVWVLRHEFDEEKKKKRS